MVGPWGLPGETRGHWGGMILTVLFAVVAAFCNAANVMTQHAASISAPKRETGLHLVRYLFRQPLWLIGWIAAVAGRRRRGVVVGRVAKVVGV